MATCSSSPSIAPDVARWPCLCLALVAALAGLGCARNAEEYQQLVRRPLAPAPRHHHALTWDPVSQRVILFAGYSVDSTGNGPLLDDLWSWDGRRWTPLAASTGIRVVGHVLFADSSGIYFKGEGRGLTGRWNGRAWDIVDQDSTTRRGGAAGALDTRRNRYAHFGGSDAPRSVNRDTWEFDGARWTRVSTVGPPPMMIAAMAYDSRRDAMVLFGGWDPSTRTTYGDTWELQLGQWHRVETSGPSPRSAAGMVYDTRRGVVLLFGGSDAASDQPLADTWTWNGSAWRRLDVTGPSPRSDAFMAYDPARGVTVLFGGMGGTPARSLGDTWEFDGSRWRQVLP